MADALSRNPARAERLTRENRIGLPARRAAVQLLHAVLDRRRPFDDALADQARTGLLSRLPQRDRALARAIAATALRRLGQLDAVFDAFLERPLPGKTGLLRPIARAALAEILFMAAPAHAIVNLAVHQARDERRTARFAALLNAVLRRAAAEGPGMLEAQDAARLNTPDWLWQSWTAAHGQDMARQLAHAHLDEAPLDLTVKDDAPAWAARLGGTALATRTVRLDHKGRIEAIPGYDDGAWWVQDAAAALPAALLGDVAGKRIADLCAAPGGKTAQLAHAGAAVTGLDIAPARLVRLADNLARLGLAAELVEADATLYRADAPFDAVLLDAPCSATGTIRRHPDIPQLKTPEEIDRLVALQDRLLQNAVRLTRPGGRLVYCTCSLQPEEGEARIKALRDSHPEIAIDPIAPQEVPGLAHSLSPEGLLRTWPCTTGAAAADGFFVARLRIAG